MPSLFRAARTHACSWLRRAENAWLSKLGISARHDARDEIAKRRPTPGRPSGMCEAQRADFIAACNSKITWRQYFAKWANGCLEL